MALTKVSYSMITGAPVNVLDYGESTLQGFIDQATVEQMEFKEST